MLKGKTFWKGLVIPNILYANDVIVFNKTELNNLQTSDNKAYRQILQVPNFTATAFLRGEVGASCSQSRDMKSKILFLKHSLEENKYALLADIVKDEVHKKSTKWFKQVDEYLKRLNMSLVEVVNNSIEGIEAKIREWDTNEWKEDMEEKKTLEAYRKNKSKIEETKWFRNGYRYSIMMKVRSNTLSLKWRERNEEDKKCLLCRRGNETLEHFLLDCSVLERVRKGVVDKISGSFTREEMMDILMIFKECPAISREEIVKMISIMYIRRNNFLKIIE